MSLIIFTACNNAQDKKESDHEWLTSQDSLTVAVFPYYAPYQFRNKNGDVDGLLIDYLAMIEEEMGYSFKKVEYTDWPLLLDHAQAGKIDMILEIQSSEQWREFLAFHDLFIESKQVLVTRKTDSIKSMEDLYGKTMVLPQEYAVIKEIQRDFPEIKVAVAPTDSVCMKMLSKGSYSAFVGPRAVVNYNKSTMRLNNLAISKILPLSYKPQIAVVKKNARLNEIIGSAINDISSNKKQRLINRWLFSEITPFYLTYRFWKKVGWIFLGFLVVVIGINVILHYKIKRSTLDLELANEAARESQLLRTQFSQNISHEIRTPMNGIMGFANLLKNRPTHGTERHHFLKTIETSGSKLNDTTNKIFEVAKLQSNTSKIKTVKVNVADFFDDLISSFEEEIAIKQIDIHLNSPATIKSLAILIDREKLTTIVKGLIENAVKFTDHGHVGVEYNYDGDDLFIYVKDSGIGISQLDKKHLFTSFSQLHKKISQRYNGLGLGLTIVMENMILLNGDLSYNSKPGTGSIFKLKIPCARVDKEYYQKLSAV